MKRKNIHSVWHTTLQPHCVHWTLHWSCMYIGHWTLCAHCMHSGHCTTLRASKGSAQHSLQCGTLHVVASRIQKLTKCTSFGQRQVELAAASCGNAHELCILHSSYKSIKLYRWAGRYIATKDSRPPSLFQQ